MNKHIVFDCETQKLFSEVTDGSKPWLLKMSTCVTYCYEDDKYKFWTYLTQNNLLSYLNGNVVIGFNSITFDCPLILGETCKIDASGNVSNEKYSWSNYDIYIEIKKRLTRTVGKSVKETLEIMRKNFSLHERGVYTLDSIAIATLGDRGRNVSGCEAVELFKQKKILELLQYNLQNVRIIKQLYDFIKEYKYAINGNFDIIKF